MQNSSSFETITATTSPSVMYIPQGRAGLINTGLIKFGINGLYTDNFSTCNIVILLGQGRSALIHFDNNMLIQMTEIAGLINYIKPLAVLIFHRNNKFSLHINNAIHELFGQLSCKNMKNVLVEDGHFGVTLGINNEKFTCTAVPQQNIPSNICHHPMERKLVAIRAMDQVIGKKAATETRKYGQRQVILFNGSCWVSLSQAEFLFNTDNAITKQELDSFNPAQNMLEIQDNFMKLKQRPNDVNESALFKEHSFTFWAIEEYVNNFEVNQQAIFKRNMLVFLNKLSPKINLTAEKQFLQTILNKISEDNCDVNEINSLISNHSLTTSSQAMQDVIFYCSTFIEHCNRRVLYASWENKNQEILAEIGEMQGTIHTLVTQGKYEEALSLSDEALHVATLNCLPDRLSDILLTHGRILFLMNDYDSALNFLEKIVQLQSAYFPSKDISEVQALIASAHAQTNTVSSSGSRSASNQNNNTAVKNVIGHTYANTKTTAPANANSNATPTLCYWCFSSKNKDVIMENIQQNPYCLPIEKLPKENINCFATIEEAKNCIKQDFQTTVNKNGPRKGFIFKIPYNINEAQERVGTKNTLNLDLMEEFQRDETGNLNTVSTKSSLVFSK